MKNRFKKVIEKLSANKTLIHNFSYLSVLQVFNLLVPLLTYPYLIRVLGKENYGLVVYAQVVVSYFQILINFGYNNLAIKEISIYRNNKQKLSEIFNSIFFSKFLFFIFSFAILGLVILFLPEARDHKLLFILCMWSGLYDVIFPIWYFQGIEKMKYITYLTLISRSIFIVLIFFLIKNPNHFIRVPMINGTGAIISGALALTIIYKQGNIVFYIPSFKTVYEHFKNSINFFVSDVFVKIFAGSNKFVIGTFLGLTELAYYDLADKIVNIFRSIPLGIVRTTIYPRIAKTRNVTILKNTTILMSIYALFAILFINALAPAIISILGGEEMLPSVNILRLFSIIIFTTHLSNYYITVGLWSLGYDNVFRNMMIFSSLIFFITYGLFWIFGIINVYSITITPIIVDIYLSIHIYFFWKKIKLNI